LIQKKKSFLGENYRHFATARREALFHGRFF